MNDLDDVQRFASVTVHVYVPAISPEAVIHVPPDGVQLYEREPVPPIAFTEIAPLFPPLQDTLLCAVAEMLIIVG